ncbi:hypothetical protein [Thermococcus sp. 2319x1]|uniref:hypothetical protein n=1 Tax=Thermococcus sp. 2319x1 TaxID=1674923 RepID=UPI0015838B87|nr:hypothetical protein [Thermococcus sp. 2319x1]
MLKIPYSKKCYVIVETPQHPYNTEDPVNVRETLQSWDVDGVFLSYNQGFGERERFYEYYSALEDCIENSGIYRKYIWTLFLRLYNNSLHYWRRY